MDHDLIVVGGGAAGLGAVRAALWAGADVAMITDSAPGGECTFTGCVPSKTLLAAARDGADFPAAMKRVRDAVGHFEASESADVLRASGATVIEGRARLVTHDTVALDDQRISAARIVIATGSKPTMPDIEGLLDAGPLTNETVWDLAELPRSVGIIGGGPTGCELAQAFAVLGSKVTLFETGSRLLPGWAPEAGALVRAALERSQATVIVNARVERVDQLGGSGPGAGVSQPRAQADDSERSPPDPGDGNDDRAAASHFEVSCADERDSATVERVLVAAGRKPSSSGLGLQELGVKLSESAQIVTDGKLETTVRGVFAAGDVACWPPSSPSRASARAPRSANRRGAEPIAGPGLSPMLAHAADEMGRLAAGNALKKGFRGRFRAETVPMTVFTDPEVATVGVAPHDAVAGSRVAYLPLSEVDRAIMERRTDGFIAIVAGPRRLSRHAGGGRILGATIVAPRAGEMIQEIALAMRCNAFAGRLAQASHAYPSWSSGVQKAAGQFFAEIEGRKARSIT